jgi:DNA-binding MarR family transcriptional regulator
VTHRIGLFVGKLTEQQLTQGEAHILALLAESSPQSVAELHRGLAHKRSTLTSILDRLERRNLITRRTGQPDRRTFIVSLTGTGRKLAGRVYRQFRNLEKRAQRKLTRGEIEAFERVLAALESEVSRSG